MKAIPTHYKSIRFKSRLEAKWAALFDKCQWPWSYELEDLESYIPDFIVRFRHSPLLVEVKPLRSLEDSAELSLAKKKIDASGWDHSALVVGSELFCDVTPWVGMTCFVADRDANGDPSKIAKMPEIGVLRYQGIWSRAMMMICVKCKTVMPLSHATLQNWRDDLADAQECFSCGGRGDFGDVVDPWIGWAEACNATQWPRHG